MCVCVWPVCSVHTSCPRRSCCCWSRSPGALREPVTSRYVTSHEFGMIHFIDIDASSRRLCHCGDHRNRHVFRMLQASYNLQSTCLASPHRYQTSLNHLLVFHHRIRIFVGPAHVLEVLGGSLSDDDLCNNNICAWPPLTYCFLLVALFHSKVAGILLFSAAIKLRLRHTAHQNIEEKLTKV